MTGEFDDGFTHFFRYHRLFWRFHYRCEGSVVVKKYGNSFASALPRNFFKTLQCRRQSLRRCNLCRDFDLRQVFDCYISPVFQQGLPVACPRHTDHKSEFPCTTRLHAGNGILDNDRTPGLNLKLSCSLKENIRRGFALNAKHIGIDAIDPYFKQVRKIHRIKNHGTIFTRRYNGCFEAVFF